MSLPPINEKMSFCPQCGHKLVWIEVDGRRRLQCGSASCNFVHWDNPTPVVAGIVELDGCVVLVRNKGWPEKWLGIVAGFLERGETPEAAILREVKEELGLDGKVVTFVGNYSFFEGNQLILAFHIQAQGEIQMGEELEEVKMILPEEVRPWSKGTGPALKDWLEARKARA